mgnify:CR=1 FL=1
MDILYTYKNEEFKMIHYFYYRLYIYFNSEKRMHCHGYEQQISTQDTEYNGMNDKELIQTIRWIH